MEEPLQMAEAVRQACIAAALQAYEDAGLSGLCQEGRWAYAVDAMRGLHLRPLVQALHAVSPVPWCFPQGEGAPGQVLGAEENSHRGSGTAQAMPQAEAPSASGTVPILSREMPSDGALEDF
jgi:hypothetical protein